MAKKVILLFVNLKNRVMDFKNRMFSLILYDYPAIDQDICPVYRTLLSSVFYLYRKEVS
ncbi:MAG: hypothetical protein PVF79_14390 [Desulfobacterales bacterium]